MMRVSVVGASGYAGGELLRLLLDHPEVEVLQATSERSAGEPVHFRHPPLRGRTSLRFVRLADLVPCDALICALPHGELETRLDDLEGRCTWLIDLSADFRLHDAPRFERWYGRPHGSPENLDRFVYGLPELHREAIRSAHRVSGVGCNAAATLLALLPLFQAGLADPARDVICEVKAGSSEGGDRAGPSTHHPVRSHAVRSFAPTRHRHTAEIEQGLELFGMPPAIHLSVTAIELVRGVLATAHVFVRDGVSERDLYQAYRDTCRDEPFLRCVKERRGCYRLPEPKILAGSNTAELGFDLDPDSGRVVALCALDNLMKGAAGNAVQCLNLMAGWEETTGLGFPGLHPI